MTPIGMLRHRVTLQKRSVAQDTTGGQVTAWADLTTVWAEIIPLAGRELVTAQAVSVEISHQINIRWAPSLASPKAIAAMRAVFKGRIFNINAALNENERNHTLTLLVSEGLNDG